MSYLRVYSPAPIEEYWNEMFSKTDGSINPKYEILHNGTVLPIKKEKLDTYLFGLAGVLDEKNQYVEISEHFTFQGQGKNRYGLGYVPENVKYMDEDVIFFGGYWKQWGHFILEQISRLWYAVKLENHGEDLIENLKFVYFSNADDVIEWKGDDFSELLSILGIKQSNFIRITEPTKFRTVIVPEQSMIFGKGFSNEYAEIIKKIHVNVESQLSKQQCSCPSKIYFSRTKFKVAHYRELGEKRLQDVFEQNGFEILYPETMGLKKKIYYINHADVIASLAGSAAHQSVFRINEPNKLSQIILLKDKEVESQSSELQSVINKHVGNKVFVVFATQNIYQAIGSIGPFLLLKTKYLNQFCFEHNIKIKKSGFSDYIYQLRDIVLFIALSIYRKIKKQYDPKKNN